MKNSISHKQNIYYIANLRLPTEKAHGVQIMKMCEAFALENNIELIVPRRFNLIKENPFDYYDVQKNFKITKLFCLDLVKLGKIGFLIELITFLISTRIYLLFKKYDILYTREWMAGLFFRNLVLEIHSLPKKVSFFHKKVWQKTKCLIVLTSFIKEGLVEIGVKEDKILIASDGVDLDRFKIYDSRFKKSDRKIVMYVGSFQGWKGTTVLLEAIRNFQFSIFNFQKILFVFVGVSEHDITDYGLRVTDYENTKFIGHQPHKEIPSWLKRADILVLPNSGKEKISKFYTSPMKLFEYMASGRPIVASDLPSIKEVLNKDNAVLVESDNTESLAEGIRIILQNPELADKISKQARLDVQHYTWKNRVKKIISFIA